MARESFLKEETSVRNGRLLRVRIQQKGCRLGPTAKLVAADAASFDQFGFAVDVNDGTIAVGASNGTASPRVRVRAVYLYQHKDGTWSRFAEFTSSDVTGGSPFPPPGGEFGTSVALRNGTLLVGSPRPASAVGS